MASFPDLGGAGGSLPDLGGGGVPGPVDDGPPLLRSSALWQSPPAQCIMGKGSSQSRRNGDGDVGDMPWNVNGILSSYS